MFDLGNKHYEFFDMLNQHAKYFNQGAKTMYEVMSDYNSAEEKCMKSKLLSAKLML